MAENIPLLAEEGWLASSKECREAIEAAQTGWSDRRNVPPNDHPGPVAPPLLCEERNTLHPYVTVITKISTKQTVKYDSGRTVALYPA